MWKAGTFKNLGGRDCQVVVEVLRVTVSPITYFGEVVYQVITNLLLSHAISAHKYLLSEREKTIKILKIEVSYSASSSVKTEPFLSFLLEEISSYR